MMAFSVSLMPFVCISSPSCNVLTLTPIHENIYVYLYSCLHTHILQGHEYIFICKYREYIHTYTFRHIHIYKHIHIDICIHMYTYTIMSIVAFRLIFGAT
jgi:hypothetical protein